MIIAIPTKYNAPVMMPTIDGYKKLPRGVPHAIGLVFDRRRWQWRGASDREHGEHRLSLVDVTGSADSRFYKDYAG